METIVNDKHYGQLVILEESPLMYFVRRLKDDECRTFWIPKYKIQIVIPKSRKKANV